MALIDIETFVIVILENRSFDHMCGYLSLPDAGPPMPVDGLQADPAWIDRYRNDDIDGTPRSLHRLPPTVQNIIDPPHEDDVIAMQIGTPTHGAAAPILGGFVKSYATAKQQPADRSPVMGYYSKEAVPVFDFFARNFAICDRWFSPLPAGTQANRLMAMGGESHIHHNVSNPLEFPDQKLVYDWLEEIPSERTKAGPLRWCSYQWGGLPFFALMQRWWGRIMGGLNDFRQTGLFRHYEKFAEHWNGDDDLIPDVVFIEPKYTDDPTSPFRAPCDDHCPTGITEGQKFLAHIYNTIISNKERWKSTMMIVTYDEHGGFFDHVPPPEVPTLAGGNGFKTTGVRIPAFVISPYVKPGSVFHDTVDTTSILHLLAERYTPGEPYSDAVQARQQFFKPLSAILDNDPMTNDPAPIPASVLDGLSHGAPAARHDTGEPTPTATAFDRVAAAMAKMHPDQFVNPFPIGTV